MNEKIAVIGMGYIGLPTALMLASNGNTVIGCDYNKSVIEKLKNSQLTFDERGLEETFRKAVLSGIEFTSEYPKASIYIIAVPTPYDKKSKKIDPIFVVNAIKNVLEICENESIIVVESTISPGTIDRFARTIVEETKANKKIEIHLVHAPERIIPGNMVYELINNSRTIGADDDAIAERVKKIYATFCKGEIVITDIRTAEMTKVVENTFRDINIAYANELAKICRSDNLDVYKIIKIANMHPRVNILSPGPGVGGHCISVDPWFLVGDYPGLANIILAARKINDSMPEFVLNRIHEIMIDAQMHDLSRVGIYGLTYKENVDDVRESPTLQLLDAMTKHLASPLKCYDPYVVKDIVENQYHDFNRFLNDIDLIVIMVAHDQIRINLNQITSKIIFDTRNICNIKGTYKL